MAQKTKANIWGVRTRPKLALTHLETWFQEDKLGSEKCYPLLKVTVLGRGRAGIHARVPRTPEAAEDPLEEGLDKMKGRGQGQRTEKDRIRNQVAAVLVRPRAAASNGAQEGPGLRERWWSPSPSASQ